jgi:hypothetical protein
VRRVLAGLAFAWIVGACARVLGVDDVAYGPADAMAGGDAATAPDTAPPDRFVAPELYIQGIAEQFTDTPSARLTFDGPVTKGSTIIVALAYDGDAAPKTVTDTFGSMNPLVGPVNQFGGQLYVAAGMAQGSGQDTVDVELSALPKYYFIVYIHEYRGLGPVDQTTWATGRTDAAATGAVTTTSAAELLFAFGASSGSMLVGPDFTLRLDRAGDITEDRFVTEAGAYQATGAPTADWALLFATFRVP